jgi:hypothetical protein
MANGNRKKQFVFPPDTTPEGVLAEIERNFSLNNPNIGKIQSCIIKNGPRTFKFAIIHEIIDRDTKQHHHNSLTLLSYQKLKDGWVFQDERKISLDNDESDEIGILVEFITKFEDYLGLEKKKYAVIEKSTYEKLNTVSQSEIGGKIREILEDADHYQKIVEQGGLNLLKDIVDWTFKQENVQSIVEQLTAMNIDSLKELSAIAGISQINKILQLWEENKDNCSEEFWQNVLSEYSWIVSQLFAAPIILYKEKAYVGGKNVDNAGGNLIDYLFQNKLSSNVALIEIKTPCTEVLGKQYRQTFAMSDEMSGAINQLLNYKHRLQQNYIAIQMAHRAAVFEVVNPRAVLIIGNLKTQFDNNFEKIEAFELFRENLRDISVLTYDELFEKVRLLKTILAGGK